MTALTRQKKITFGEMREAGVDPSLRGESLGVAEFARIAAAGREHR